MAIDLTTAKPNYFGTTGDLVTRIYTDTYYNDAPMIDDWCGGLYNRDSIGYYRLPVVGRRVSELKEPTRGRLEKLCSDIIHLNTQGTIILDKQIEITTNLDIPAEIKFLIEPDGGFNVSAGAILTINSEIDTKSQRLVYGEGNVYFAGNQEVWSDAFGTVPILTNFNPRVVPDSPDQHPFLQKCIDSCKNTNAIMRTRAGRYCVDAPLLIMPDFDGTEYAKDYISLTWHGTGATTDTYYRSTRIIARHIGEVVVDGVAQMLPQMKTFAIGIQNGRNIHLTNIQVFGYNPVSTEQPVSTTRYETMVFVWDRVRDSRYSPYAGIVIDPFFSLPDAEHILSTEERYPGFEDYYYIPNANATSGTKFEFVAVEDFVVGFLISPSGYPKWQLGSEITWMDCRVDGAKSGIASCDAQNRNLYWYAGSVGSCKYCFDSVTYGTQNGNIPRIYGVNINGNYIFNSKGQSGEQAIHITGMHAESIGGIGWVGTQSANANNTAKIEDSRINFGDHRGSVDFQITCYGNLELVGCTLQTECFRAYLNQAATLTLRNCKLTGLNGEPVVSSNNAYNTIIDNCFFSDTKLQSGALVSNGTTQMSKYLTPSILNGVSSSDINNRAHLVNGQMIVSKDQDKLLIANAPEFSLIPSNNYYQITEIIMIPLDDDGDGITRAIIQLDSNWVGKLKLYTQIMCRTTAIKYEDFTGERTFSSGRNIMGCVEAFDEVTFKATLRNVPDAFAVAVTTATNTGQPLPSYRIAMVGWRRYHAPTTITGITGTTTITLSTPDAWQVGDRIRGTGIPEGTFIKEKIGSGASTTFTLSTAFTATTGVSVYDAEVQEYTPMLQSAALNTANNPVAVTQGTTAPGATYAQAEAEAVQTQLVTLTTQYNALLARFDDLVSKDQAAKIRA
ncbi:hypothetical protein ACLI09_10460 [Flavobacterium sp. RHBU_24]|uniref:hypothetical protein n=1 Tax=Flavobacterium sp. RHBU_24 TaxID=3391185 RepID=UPI003984CB4A